MIRTESIDALTGIIPAPEEGREVDPFNDSEQIRLVAMNLELAVKNLVCSNVSPDCLVLTADLCTHRLVAMPTDNGVRVLVFDT